MHIWKQLSETTQLQKQLSQVERLKSEMSVRFPGQSPTNIEDIFQENLRMMVKDIRQKVDIFQQIDQEVTNETIIPKRINVKEVAPLQKDTIPPWFTTVFESQFEHHVQGLNFVAKKLYQNRFSEQERNQTKQLLMQFQTLISRIASIQKKEKLTQGLFHEINSIRNRIEHQENKYRDFLESLAARVTDFCKFVEGKAIGLSSSIEEYIRTLKGSEPGRYEPQQTQQHWAKTMADFPTAGSFGVGGGIGQTVPANPYDNFKKTLPRMDSYVSRQMGETRMSFQPQRGYSATNIRLATQPPLLQVPLGAFNLPKKLYEDFYY